MANNTEQPLPHLSQTRLEWRTKGLAIVCLCGGCQYPVGYISQDGLRQTFPHGKENHPREHSSDDLRRMADLIDDYERIKSIYEGSDSDILQATSERAA